MLYIENPKTKGSGILCAIPQAGRCPIGCSDCFFQSGRSYLEPLADNLPNLPDPRQAQGHVIRVNDGNDSNVCRDDAISATDCYANKFFNTSIPRLDFPVRQPWDGKIVQAPVVLTLNPGKRTDESFWNINDCGLEAAPANLMFVRFRANTWNQALCRRAVEHWTALGVDVVLTFMAYHEKPAEWQGYDFRKRTLNSYWAISAEAWRSIMFSYRNNPRVYSCGEGPQGSIKCAACGNCLRTYFAAKERIGF